MWKKPDDEMPPRGVWVFVVQEFATESELRAVTELDDGIDPPENCGLAYWDGEEWRTEIHEEALRPLLWTPFPRRDERARGNAQ